MNLLQYRELCKQLGSVSGIASTTGKRRGLEQRYFQYHRQRGVRLRGKYRL